MEKIKKPRGVFWGDKNPNWRGGKFTKIKKLLRKGRIKTKYFTEEDRMVGEREIQRRWNKNHRTYRNYMDMIRRMKLRNIEGSFSLEQWNELKEKFNYTCLMCGQKEPKIKLSIDHIVPITKGGDNYITNIQPLCRNCNSKKGNRI